MRTLVAFAALVVFGALVGPAQAFAPSANVGLHKYEQAAAAFWGELPNCEGQVSYYWPAADPWGEPVDGRAAFKGCEVWLIQWGSLEGGGFWGYANYMGNCGLFLHEWGHLVGHDHDTAPGGLNDWGDTERRIADYCDELGAAKYPRMAAQDFDSDRFVGAKRRRPHRLERCRGRCATFRKHSTPATPDRLKATP